MPSSADVRSWSFCLPFALALASAAGQAQTPPYEPVDDDRVPLGEQPGGEPMETDRPDFTEGTQTVPPARFQLEMGYTFASNDDDGVRATMQTAPEALLRIGLVDDVELRLGWDGYEWFDVDGGPSAEDGFTDMEIGVKIRALDQDGVVPNLAFIPAFTVPVGSRDQTADQVDPSMIIAAAYDLTDAVSLGVNFGLAGVSDEDGDRFLETSVSTALGFTLTEWVGAFVEYYAIFPDDPAGEDEHYADGGFTFPVQPNLQFDIRAGVGLSEGADDWFAGAGFAVRF